jgi:hypothetical protein
MWGKTVIQFTESLQLGELEQITISNNGIEADEVINHSNYQSKRGTSIVRDGTVTIEYVGLGKVDPLMRYITGDHEFITITGKHSAIWRDLIEPNSYAVVDDTDYYEDSFTPVITAFFDENKTYQRSERTFCIDPSKKIPSLATIDNIPAFPGRIQYTRQQSDDYNIDSEEGHTDADKLVAARILWLLNESRRPEITINDYVSIQYAIWNLQGSGSGTGNSFYEDAIAQVPSLPNPPEPEPFTLSLAPGEINKANPGGSIRLLIEISESVSNLKLTIPTDLDLSVVTPGNSYDPLTGILTVSSQTIELDLTSEAIGKFTIQASYENPAYYNIQNLNIYVPCDTEYQRFLHVGETNPLHPFRSYDLEWTDQPLPVHLVSFEAKSAEGGVVLDWRTTQEENFSHFEIQKSMDSKAWKVLGTTASNKRLNYRFVDPSVSASIQYYRLKMVDLDGMFSYGPIQSIATKLEHNFLTLHPNPASGHLFVPSDLVEEVSLLDLSGRKVSDQRIKSDRKIELNELQPGIYLAILHLKNGDRATQRIIVQTK